MVSLGCFSHPFEACRPMIYSAPMPDQPEHTALEAFIEQAYARQWVERDLELDTMESLLPGMAPASREAILLRFALGKIHDDLGNTERSFRHFETANRYHRLGKTDTIDDARNTVAAVREIFSSQSVILLQEEINYQPLFILGMPRSGTTLVEQILASHPQVHGGGELPLMGQWCYGYVRLYAQYHQQAPLNNYLPQLREHYVQGLRQLSSCRDITDKMPMNFLWLGFILSAFPTARIIHTERNPMAVCWSIFRTPFSGTSNGYACDLADIGAFYRLYHDLMIFWKERFSQPIYTLNYENLTIRQEAETRKLLEYCELQWDTACMEFYRNPREVRTSSSVQVRRPMYQGSSEAWQRFEPFLGPLKRALDGDLGPD